VLQEWTITVPMEAAGAAPPAGTPLAVLNDDIELETIASCATIVVIRDTPLDVA
jgi:hypothetical protein